MKLTVDLEKKLVTAKTKFLREIEKEIKDQDALLANVNNILENNILEDAKALENAGFGKAIENAKNVKIKADLVKNKRDNLSSPRIFTINEIRSIAVNYGLRFLPTNLYKGILSADLPAKIKAVTEELGLTNKIKSDYEVNSWENYDYVKYDDPYKSRRYFKKGSSKSDYFILAPKSSFELEKRPVDPLLFLKLSDGTYYLVHKWGNDLSLFRYVINLFCRNAITKALTLLSVVFFVIYFIANLIPGYENGGGPIAGLIFVTLIISLITITATNGKIVTGNNKNWNNNFED